MVLVHSLLAGDRCYQCLLASQSNSYAPAHKLVLADELFEETLLGHLFACYTLEDDLFHRWLKLCDLLESHLEHNSFVSIHQHSILCM